MLKKNIYICGFMGCGKSTIGSIVSKKIKSEYIDTDIYIENLNRLSIDKIFSIYGEKYFRKQETITLKRISHKKSKFIISTGGGTFLKNKNIKIAKKNGIIVYIYADIDIALKRAKNKERPLLKNSSKKEKEKLYFERTTKFKKIADYIIYNNNTKKHCIKKLLYIINNLT